MATKVYTTYTASMNQSVTVKDGVITKVSDWVTGVPGSTNRIVLSSGAAEVHTPTGKVIRSRRR